MNPRKHEKPKYPQVVKPITWHEGWQEVASATGEDATTDGESPTGLYRGDQSHLGVEHRVELSTEPTVLMADGCRRQQYLSACLEQQAEGAPRVFISHTENVGVAATLDEARRFALEILSLIARAG